MFSKNQIETIAKEEITLSNAMVNRINLWEQMLEGKAPWCNPYNDDEVQSLGLEGAICREFANTALSEMDTSLEIDELNELYLDAISSLSEKMQNGLGLGEFAIKPIADTGECEVIPADRIIPFEFGADGKLRKCAFIQIKPQGDNDVYYRLEFHELTPQGLRIINKAFKGTDENIGQEIQLSTLSEWSSLMPEVMYPGMKHMDFGFYKNPLPNRIDGSENGVSIFENAVGLIKKADIQLNRLDWEFESGERLIFGDYQIFNKTRATSDSSYTWKMPKGKKRLFVGIETGDDTVWNEHSPNLREQNFINGLNEYKREIEFAVGLAYGDLSKGDVVEKTATEIIASKKRKYDMVTAIQKNLKVCLEDFAIALAFYHNMYTAHIGFSCVFHDSIKVDDETQRAQDRLDMQLGIMSKIEYRMKWYGEDDHTASNAIALVNAEIQQSAEHEGDIE